MITAIKVALLWVLAQTAFATGADAILGTWSTEDRYGNRDAVVEIARRGEVFVGTVVWVKYRVYPDDDPKGMAGETIRDRENPDPALRERPILGLPILQGLRFNGEQWVGGQIYSPREGATYRAKLWLEDRQTLKVRGYVGMPVFGMNATWRRATLPAAENQTNGDPLTDADAPIARDSPDPVRTGAVSSSNGVGSATGRR